jgi:hypothetical protein
MLCDTLHISQQHLSGIEVFSLSLDTCNGREKMYTHILSSLLSYVQISCLFMKDARYSHVNGCSRMPSAGDRTSVMLY